MTRAMVHCDDTVMELCDDKEKARSDQRQSRNIPQRAAERQTRPPPVRRSRRRSLNKGSRNDTDAFDAVLFCQHEAVRRNRHISIFDPRGYPCVAFARSLRACEIFPGVFRRACSREIGRAHV